MRLSLDDRIQRYLDKCEVAVEDAGGCHDLFLRTAICLIQGFELNDKDARYWVTKWSDRCQPPWLPKEIDHKISEARKKAPPAGKQRGWLLGDREAEGSPTVRHDAEAVERPGFGRTPSRPVFNIDALRSYVSKCGVPREEATGLALRMRSPVETSQVTSDAFLRALYGEEDRVLVFTVFESQGDFLWTPKQTVRLDKGDKRTLAPLPKGGAQGVWYLCNPVDGKWHAKSRHTNKMSRRSGSAVTAWRYLLLESDEDYPIEWIQVLMSAPLRIVAIYTSGGKSLHALVRVDAECKEEFDRHRADALRSLVALGADGKAISGVRLTRLPGCLRDRREQELIWLDPEAGTVPIYERPYRQRDFVEIVKWKAGSFLKMSVDDRRKVVGKQSMDREDAVYGVPRALYFYRRLPVLADMRVRYLAALKEVAAVKEIT